MRWFALAMFAGCGFQRGTAATAVAGDDAPASVGSDAAGEAPTPDAPSLPGDSGTSALLQVTRATVPDGDTNLSTEGLLDWAHWSYPDQTVTFNHKIGGNLISDVAETPSFVVLGSSMTFSWIGGTPNATVSQTGTAYSVMTSSGPTALHFTVSAGLTTHTLRLYLGVKLATARLDLSLSDSSAVPYVDTQTSSSAAHFVYTITYRAAAANQTLNIAWTGTNDQTSQAYTGLFSATLQ